MKSPGWPRLAALLAVLPAGGCGNDAATDCVTTVFRVTVNDVRTREPIATARVELLAGGGTIREEKPCGGAGCSFRGRKGLYALRAMAPGYRELASSFGIRNGDDGVPRGRDLRLYLDPEGAPLGASSEAGEIEGGRCEP
jgi:hypothetical protein